MKTWVFKSSSGLQSVIHNLRVTRGHRLQFPSLVNDERIFTIASSLYVQLKLKGHFITTILEANLQDFARLKANLSVYSSHCRETLIIQVFNLSITID